MGLANKMAAFQQQQGGAPPQQQQQQGGYAPPQGAPPPQQYGGYAPPPGGPPPQQQQQQQYGAPPGAPPQQQYQQPQQQYYAPPPPPRSAIDPRALEQMLEFTVKDQNLQAFYPPGSLGPIAQRIIQSGAIDQIGQMFKLDPVGAMPLAKLALFDISLLCDDSGSMAFTKWNGERLDDLNLILSKVSTAASLFDADGITIRFLNSTREGNNVRTEQEAMQLLHGLEYKYQTPLGGALDKKILQPFVLGPALSGRMQKPALIIIITDGAPSDGDLITRVIKDANSKLKRTRYGADAISIQIAQVGNDLEAQDFLASIDADRTIGDLVDCTSNFESESAEMEKKTGKPLTPEGWLLKMLLGGIDSSYDRADEAPGHGHGSSNHSSGGGLFGGGGSSSGKKSKFGGLFSKK